MISNVVFAIPTQPIIESTATDNVNTILIFFEYWLSGPSISLNYYEKSFVSSPASVYVCAMAFALVHVVSASLSVAASVSLYVFMLALRGRCAGGPNKLSVTLYDVDSHSVCSRS